MLSTFQAFRPEHLASLVAGFAEAPPRALPPPRIVPDAPALLASRGWLEMEGVTDDGERDALVVAIEQLVRAGLPGVSVYAFPGPWRVGVRVRDAVSRLLAEPYALVEDAWAFLVRPGRSGWAPHRGIDSSVLDRERPEYLNVWIALSDAGIERSCMHFVPLDRDPAYPAALAASDEAQLRHRHPADAITPAPVGAGTGLVWNANALHWGGPCEPHASGPRLSVTFSLCRIDALSRPELGGVRVIEPEALSAWERIDVVARQIAIYGAGQDDVSEEVRRWAEMTAELSDRFGADREAGRKEG